MFSLCLGLSLLKETTDSVSVWSSRVSTLPAALGWKDGGLESPMPPVLSAGGGGKGGGGGEGWVVVSTGGTTATGGSAAGVSEDTSHDTTLPLKHGNLAPSS